MSGFFIMWGDTNLNFEGLWDLGAPASTIIGVFHYPFKSWTWSHRNSFRNFLEPHLLSPVLRGQWHPTPMVHLTRWLRSTPMSVCTLVARCVTAVPSMGGVYFFTFLSLSWPQHLLWQIDQGRSNGLGIWSPAFKRLSTSTLTFLPPWNCYLGWSAVAS